MGILDEAIREHLELKRQHGADDSELQQLEDDAFGPPQRPGGDATPDAESEAPTEFMSQPEPGDAAAEHEPEGADAVEPEGETAEPPSSARRAPVEGFIDLQEAPGRDDGPEAVEDEEPRAEEEQRAEDEEQRPPPPPNVEDQPAAEHEAVREIPGGPNTEERHAIADQPTQMFDVEQEFDADEEEAPVDRPAPPDEDLVAEEIGEPRLAPPPEPIEDDEEDFFDGQRLSDELDQALEAPIEDAEEEEAHEDEGPAEDEPADRTEVHQLPDRRPDEEHDALEETPDFLEQSPDDDQLWFEQKPPKDFDFDD
jgi:hypothetical protein